MNIVRKVTLALALAAVGFAGAVGLSTPACAMSAVQACAAIGSTFVSYNPSTHIATCANGHGVYVPAE
jgi:hypothetical protein